MTSIDYDYKHLAHTLDALAKCDEKTLDRAQYEITRAAIDVARLSTGPADEHAKEVATAMLIAGALVSAVHRRPPMSRPPPPPKPPAP